MNSDKARAMKYKKEKPELLKKSGSASDWVAYIRVKLAVCATAFGLTPSVKPNASAQMVCTENSRIITMSVKLTGLKRAIFATTKDVSLSSQVKNRSGILLATNSEIPVQWRNRFQIILTSKYHPIDAWTSVTQHLQRGNLGNYKEEKRQLPRRKARVVVSDGIPNEFWKILSLQELNGSPVWLAWLIK